MLKIVLRTVLFIVIIFTISVIYLSTIGIKTSQFNGLIKNKLIELDPRLRIELEEVKLILDLSKKEIKASTNNTNLYLDNNLIELSKININIDLFSLFENKNTIKNLEIHTIENSIKDVFSFLKSYRSNFSLILLEHGTQSGSIKAKIKVNFDVRGRNYPIYNASGQIKNAQFNLLKNQNANNIYFNFNFTDKEYKFKDVSLEYKKIKLNSEEINITKENKNYIVEGNFQSKKKSINPKVLFDLFKINFDFLSEEEIKIETNNNFTFKINEKQKIKDLKIKSNLKFDKLIINYNSVVIKNYLKDYKNIVNLKDGIVDIDYSKNSIFIKGASKYSLDKDFDDLKFDILKNNNNFKFNTIFEINSSPLLLKAINYSKEKNDSSIIRVKGNYLKDNEINLDQILYSENNNSFEILKLKLNKNFKILDINKIVINYLNQNKEINNFTIEKNKKNYVLLGKSMDSTKLIDDLLKDKKNKRFFEKFENLNTRLDIKIDRVILDKKSYLENLNGHVEFNKNKIITMNLKSQFPNKDKFLFSIDSVNNNEKVTTLYSENAEPFVRRFKFIKGFEGGKIDFFSINKKNGVSVSKIKIFEFKVKEVPALATLLSLASLQGIADLMTGEGIRFDEFEMNFKNKDKLMTIDEIYAIGPAISLLMSGYVEKDELISLRGTLVPATTINKAIRSIPILGNILIGKKPGEGVFGVSFKIKGPPKDLKTTVNPVKTLTPRFITRTLEKIKKNN